MSHTIVYNSEEHIIELKVLGRLTMGEIREIIPQMVSTIKEKDCFSIVSDYREAELNLSTIDIYEVPKMISIALGEFDGFRLKRALVVTKDLKDFHFFDTVSFNQGQNVKLFQDIVEAKKWLSNK